MKRLLWYANCKYTVNLAKRSVWLASILFYNIYQIPLLSHNIPFSRQEFCIAANPLRETHTYIHKVRKRAKIRTRYNQVPHLTQDTNRKVTNSQLDITNESQKASLFSAGDHKAAINRHAQKHNKHTTEITWMIHKRSTALERSIKMFYWRA